MKLFDGINEMNFFSMILMLTSLEKGTWMINHKPHSLKQNTKKTIVASSLTLSCCGKRAQQWKL
jgi:ABC-type transporter Mla maintaining outer membrane lipid asymmetry permease subunit MlaE